MKYFSEAKVDGKEVSVLINVIGFDPDDKLKEIVTEHGDKLFTSICEHIGWLMK